jgi:adenine-specific DNA-methyltransferase
LHWPRDEDFFKKNDKIVSVRKCATPLFHYSNVETYVMMAVNVIKTDKINLKYLTTFLNSKLIYFWLKYEGKMQGSNFQVDKEPLMNIPIHKPNDYSPFIELFDIINYVLSTKEAIVENVDNKHIANFIEEVIDGCFFDIYFPEQMIENNLTITENVKNHLDIAGLSDKYKEVKYENMKTNIDVFYNNLKNDVVQQRMRMYTVKSPNILKPILES